MRVVPLLAAILLVATASAEVVVSHSGDGAVTTGYAVLGADGSILTHQNVVLDMQGPGLGIRSDTLHDHDAFFWILTQPNGTGVVTTKVDASGDEGTGSHEVAPGTGRITASMSVSGTDLVLETDRPVTAFVRILFEDALLSWARVDATESTTIASFTPGESFRVLAHFIDGKAARYQELDFTPEEPTSPTDPITSLLPSQEEATQIPAPCTKLRMEPDGSWYEATHVRISADPANRLAATDSLDMTYGLFDAQGNGYVMHVNDPFGHVVLRAPFAGAWTLDVAVGDETCRQPIEVRPSSENITAQFDVTHTATGFEVFFDADTDQHYDVDAVVRDQADRLVFAGKIHSHAMGTGAAFDVPVGTYTVDAYAVAQGTGPTVSNVLHRTITVDADTLATGAKDRFAPDEESPGIPLALVLMGLVAMALRRR